MLGLYLLIVVNNFISVMVCGVLGFFDVGLVFFGVGVFFWLSFELVIFQCLCSVGELLMLLCILLGIQLVFVLVVCSVWFSVNGGEVDIFVKLLFGYGLLQLLFMFCLMFWYFCQLFNVFFWSFLFGIFVLVIIGLYFGQVRGDGFFYYLVMLLFIFSNLVVGLLLLCIVLLLVSGKLLFQVDWEIFLNKKEGL